MILDKKQLKINIKAEIKKTVQDIVELKKQTSPISPENSIGRIIKTLVFAQGAKNQYLLAEFYSCHTVQHV